MNIVLDPKESTDSDNARAMLKWEARIREVQSRRATPELLTKIKTDNERQRSAGVLKKKAMRLERTNMLNYAQSAIALQSFSRASAAASAAASYEYEESNARTERYGRSIQACISKSRARRTAPVKSGSTAIADLGGNSSDEDVDALEAEMRSEMFALHERTGEVDSTTSSVIRAVFDYNGLDSSGQQQVVSTISTELDTLLKQLSQEPTNDGEIAAKFSLFETFLANVVAIREETLGFWDDSKDQFSETVKNVCQREITGIDSNDAMGIIYDPRLWFVYSMTKKASENSSKISQILASLRARLEILSQDIGECPYCLDQVYLDSSTVLGCCHRVCTDCWTHWVELKKEAAFCPLCRHDEFLSEVFHG